ncbi:membrane protein [Streptomyces alboflavus]|uniref:Membrane protein n=1 Tax=Streptomyces alboflavus TaxID=67267 RepID=A0A1Z1WRE8_9ACTN|nr:membrane protein [Streptomyces alboflavus]
MSPSCSSLPVTTHATTNAWIERAVRTVHACTREAAARLSGSATADPAPHIADLEVILGRVRLSLAPLVHPLSPLRARRVRARQVIALLDECADQVRSLTAIATDPVASCDDRLAAACARVEAAVEALIASEEALTAPPPPPPSSTPGPSNRPSRICTAWSGHCSNSRRRCAARRVTPLIGA